MMYLKCARTTRPGPHIARRDSRGRFAGSYKRKGERRTRIDSFMAPTKIRIGDRVRGCEWFADIRGAVGTVTRVDEVICRDGRSAQDILGEFDRPVEIFLGELQTRLYHSAHNFERVGEGGAATKRRREETNHEETDDDDDYDSTIYKGHR